MQAVLSEQRKFTTPESGEDWNSVAARVLPDEPVDSAIQTLKSWNLHLLVRVPPGEFTGSDVLFLEPPREPGGSLMGTVDMTEASNLEGA
jgi:hypothetical protein